MTQGMPGFDLISGIFAEGPKFERLACKIVGVDSGGTFIAETEATILYVITWNKRKSTTGKIALIEHGIGQELSIMRWVDDTDVVTFDFPRSAMCFHLGGFAL